MEEVIFKEDERTMRNFTAEKDEIQVATNSNAKVDIPNFFMDMFANLL